MIRIVLFVIIIILILRILLLSRMENKRRISNRWYSETDFKKVFGEKNFRKSLQGDTVNKKARKSKKKIISG
ncbi:MAG TPA: hypothetical protein P5190_10075 [Bacteroidales bacterium]|nr:hypothetical protein [Bacteroidales bacterium]